MVVKTGKRAYIKSKQPLTAKIRQHFYDNRINLYTDKLQHSTIPKLAFIMNVKKKIVKDIVDDIRKGEETRLATLETDNCLSGNIAVGCPEEGRSPGCLNCIGARNSWILGFKDDEACKLHRQVVTMGKNGVPYYNGKVVINPNWFNKKEITLTGKSKNVILVYDGEITGLCPNELLKAIVEIFEYAYVYANHNFMILTKHPEKLLEPVIETIKILSEKGIDITQTNNIHAIASIEDKEYLHRIKELQKLPDFISKHPWYKPLLGLLPYHDLTGITSTRIASEKGLNARSCNPEWIASAMKNSQIQGIPTYYDTTSDEAKMFGVQTVKGHQATIEMILSDMSTRKFKTTVKK